ncbi:MAG: aminoacyl-tRNA hydrolase [Anaerolineaceae bacterium]|nr:aminoacyl-tRNA hydrolase [Anaerolineaceae bacterium]
MLKLFGVKRPSNDIPGEPFLIVGLGNPGREYRANRHNIGFMATDELARRNGANFSRVQANSLVLQVTNQGQRWILAKPQTFMNISGQAVEALLRFYKIPLERMLVMHDDLDLPFGTLRMRPGGGSGGQRGLASIIEKLGTQEFPRLRLGIGRPPGRMDAADYVLQDFSPVERELLPAILARAAEAAAFFTMEGLEKAMNLYNGELSKE